MKKIIVENLSKKYILGSFGSSTLTNEIKNWWENKKAYGQIRSIKNREHDKIHNNEKFTNELWALKNISFYVNEGDAMGIIGKNGAGKSTLLKILSKVTGPSDGKIKIKGRVASLLEVGTGFHPELTGRENIFLNGSVLGMNKAEIKNRFDEIVDFAGVEHFLNTPVKRYSSGMYVRLAFSVAAHLEPEVLIVDEVLAVGDLEFQQKCLGKMGKISGEGRTVLFVSHNLDAILQLCNKGLLLEDGKVQVKGTSKEVVEHYLKKNQNLRSSYYCVEVPKDRKLKVISAIIKGSSDESKVFSRFDKCRILITYQVFRKVHGAQIGIEIYNDMEVVVFTTTNQDYYGIKEDTFEGIYSEECPIELSFFREGTYKIRIVSSIPGLEILDDQIDLLFIKILDSSSPLIKLGQNRKGIIFPIIKWSKHKSIHNE